MIEDHGEEPREAHLLHAPLTTALKQLSTNVVEVCSGELAPRRRQITPHAVAPILKRPFHPHSLPPSRLLSSASSSSPREAASDLEQARPQTSGEEELQLQLALAMSREENQKVELHTCRPARVRRITQTHSCMHTHIDAPRRLAGAGTRTKCHGLLFRPAPTPTVSGLRVSVVCVPDL